MALHTRPLAMFNRTHQHRVGACQLDISLIQRHPAQRALRQDWVDSLVRSFEEGDDRRGEFPIHVIPASDAVEGSLSVVNGMVSVPDASSFYVFEGQHRVAAWTKFTENHPQEERVWPTVVFKRGACPPLPEVPVLTHASS